MNYADQDVYSDDINMQTQEEGAGHHSDRHLATSQEFIQDGSGRRPEAQIVAGFHDDDDDDIDDGNDSKVNLKAGTIKKKRTVRVTDSGSYNNQGRRAQKTATQDGSGGDKKGVKKRLSSDGSSARRSAQNAHSPDFAKEKENVHDEEQYQKPPRAQNKKATRKQKAIKHDDSDSSQGVGGSGAVINTDKLQKEDAHIYALSEPTMVTNIMVNSPVCLSCTIFGVLIFFAFLAVAFEWLLPMNPSRRDFFVWGSDTVNAFDKTLLIKSELQKIGEEITDLQSMINPDWATIIVYNTPNEKLEVISDSDNMDSGSSMEEEVLQKKSKKTMQMMYNVWSPRNLIAVRDFEAKLFELDLWPSLCFLERFQSGDVTNTDPENCSQKSVKSPLDLLNGREGDLEEMSQAQLNEFLKNALENPVVWKQYKPFFDNNLTVGELKVTYMRTILSAAGPLQDDQIRYVNLEDRQREQRDIITEFQKDVRDLSETESMLQDVMEIRVYGQPLFNVTFQEVLQDDVAYAIFSVAFVFFYIWFHLESLFMAIVSMLLILLSFPMSYFIYSGILQISMNTTLNQLVIFIVLGIAADDIFVFCDAWRQSSLIPLIANDQKRRMAFAFRRSFKAIMVTSSTTAIAFLSNALSDIRPIRAFGIFAAIIIPVNFAILILTIPAIQIIHDKYLKNQCSYASICSCVINEKTNPNRSDQQAARKIKGGSQEPYRTHMPDGSQPPQESSSRVTMFLAGPFNRVVRRSSRSFVFFFGILGIAATILATFIGPLTEDDAMLPADHPFMQIQKLLAEEFSSTADQKEALRVNIIWGTDGLDRDDVKIWDPEDLGKLIWDDTFTVAPAENQRALLDFCKYLRNESPLVKDEEVQCWIEDFNMYVQSSTSGQLSLPIEDEEKFDQLLVKFAFLTEKGKMYVETQQLGFDATKSRLKTMRIIASSVGKPRAPRSEKLPIYESWEDTIAEFSDTAPKGLKKLFQNANIFWAWMNSEKAFYDGAIQGMIVSVTLAFLIILIATQNAIIAVYSIISVIFIVGSVTSVMVLMGWELGVPESVATVIVIGFSVDYVVHLAAHYVHSPLYEREAKATEAISDMGISIFSGAVTTLGSGIFLFFGTLVFFQKFALVITMTVLFSLLYALVFFLAFLHAYGPQGLMGNLCIFWRACVETCNEQRDISKQQQQRGKVVPYNASKSSQN